MSVAPLLGAWLSIVATASPADDPKAVDFARDVRPVLAKHCHSCHGAEKQNGGLRLDRKARALAGGDSGAAIEPGDPGESLLIHLVSGQDPERVMPPKGDRLGASEIATLRAWIEAGAPWPDGADGSAGSLHWAFRRPERPPVPEVKGTAHVRNPIDSFVLAKLEKEGVDPSPEADRSTLIRRLSLDLLGLPPTPDEVDTFLKDDAPDAYDRLVDRLLASPRYGERWGRHWLDLARYADSDGYEKDSPRPHAWRYRDWVIDALNRDLPFDQFTTEQLAGDLLLGATLEQKVATGFHRNTLTNKEGGTDPEEFRVAAVVDRVNTTATVWLGLTVACAQCHTHKYDPIQHHEYYGLFAFFNSDDEADLPAAKPEETRRYESAKAAFDSEHQPLAAALKAYEDGPGLAKVAEWERAREGRPRWVPLAPESFSSEAGASMFARDDRSVLVAGPNPPDDSVVARFKLETSGVTTLKLDVLTDPSLGSNGPGRTGHGNFVLSEFRVEAKPKDGPARPIKVASASADYAQDDFDAARAIDGDLTTGWAVAGALGKPHRATFELAEDVGGPGTTLVVRLDQRYGDQHTIGRFRVSAIVAPRPVSVDEDPEDLAAALAVPPESRSPEQRAVILAQARKSDPEWKRLADAVAMHLAKAPTAPDAKAQTLTLRGERRKTNIHLRGDFLRKGDEVAPHTLGVLHPFPTATPEPSRLDLARWLLDPANPLTSRVVVNRVWAHLFGRGLVATPDDFGVRGESPSHPDLLDWLAVEFRESGWGQKALIRLIVTSATYRQTSRTRTDLIDRDPTNRWLARQARFRPEAEVVRDVALSVAGLLAPGIGGPSVRPPQPPGIAELTYAGSARWVPSEGPDRYRRGMYTFFQRTSPYPMLMTFDAPDSNVCAVRRERSNTPLQALTLLNDATFVECAQGLARRVVAESPSPSTDGRLKFATRIALARDPSPREAAVLCRLFEAMKGQCRERPEEAARLAGAPVAGVEPADLAAWVAVSRTILNLDEFLTRD